jgi:hypothetical protein
MSLRTGTASHLGLGDPPAPGIVYPPEMLRRLILALGAIAVGLAAQASCTEETRTDASSTASSADVSKPTFPSETRPDHRAEIRKKQTLQEAIDYARRFMSRDENLAHSELRPIGGTLLLALWAPDHLTWAELQTVPEAVVPPDEKLSEEQFGLRICASGPVLQVPRIGVQAIPAAIITRKHGFFRVVLTQATQGLGVGSDFAFCGIYTGSGWEPSISAPADSIVGMAQPAM